MKRNPEGGFGPAKTLCKTLLACAAATGALAPPCPADCATAPRAEAARFPVTRVGAINWDCSVPSWTYFGAAATRSLGPEKYRDRTPFYAQATAPGKIEFRHRTLAEHERELRYAIAAGIDYFAYCWYDLNQPPGNLEKGKAAANADGHLQEITFARLAHAKSALREKLHLCAILVTCHPYSDDELTRLALEMREPWYEKIGNRPLVYFFTDRPEPAARLREICRKVGAADPYAVCMTGKPRADASRYAGFDALGSYACGVSATSHRDYTDRSLAANEARAKTGLPTIPHFALGWNPSPRVDNPVPWCRYGKGPWAPPATADDWLDAAQRLRDWIASHPAACPTGHVLAFAWNEFEEGGWICPTLKPDGSADTARVAAFARAVKTLKAPCAGPRGCGARRGGGRGALQPALHRAHGGAAGGRRLHPLVVKSPTCANGLGLI